MATRPSAKQLAARANFKANLKGKGGKGMAKPRRTGVVRVPSRRK